MKSSNYNLNWEGSIGLLVNGIMYLRHLKLSSVNEDEGEVRTVD